MSSMNDGHPKPTFHQPTPGTEFYDHSPSGLGTPPTWLATRRSQAASWLSGTTAGRPGTGAVGLFYWDTTLGKPIWWNGSVWKDATGATV